MTIAKDSKKEYLEELLNLTIANESIGNADVLPSQSGLTNAYDKLLESIPAHGLGLDKTFRHLVDDIVPGLSNQAQKHYYGFVTGGTTPAAHLADNIVTLMDQNLGAHLPNDSVASTIEAKALKMILELLKLDPQQFPGRTFTTGATASNILALECAREWIIDQKLKKLNQDSRANSVSQIGLFEAMRLGQVDKIQILSCMSHSSLGKAAAIVGLGRDAIVEVRGAAPWDFDLEKLEQRLRLTRTVNIVAVNFGEVNTGQFTTRVSQIKKLCTKYGAWLHIDGAFGMYARLLLDYKSNLSVDAKRWVDGLELADSITGDAHKTLNVPYDCGFYFTKDLSLMAQIFHNPGAPYLKTNNTTSSIVSPFQIGLENSRRFRALPVYATLVAYGTEGYRAMFENLVQHARRIATWIKCSEKYDLLPEHIAHAEVCTIVLFRARNDELNNHLHSKINATKKLYVSPTQWDGQPAVRLAVCNWAIAEGDEKMVIEVLDSL